MAFQKMCNVTHWLLVEWQDMMRLPFSKMSNSITHFLLVIGQDVIRLPFKNMCIECHSPTIGHGVTRVWWDFLSEICATHILLVIGQHVMNCLTFQKYVLNVTHLLLFIVQDSTWGDCLSAKCPMSLTSCWSYIGQDVMRLLFRNMCNVTHKLLVIGQGVMGLPCTKCAMSLTFCWP